MPACYVVVGAGITGLVAARELSRRGCRVLLVERESRLGGLLRVTTLEGAGIPIEEFYHAVFEGETNSLQLIDDLGLTDRLEWSEGPSAFHAGGRVHRLSTALDLLQYPPLTLRERFRAGLTTWRMLRVRDVSAHDGVSARDWLCARAGTNAYEKFFAPLLRGKFADEADTVAASWFISRMNLRNRRGRKGEHLGYLRGSFKTLLVALEDAIVSHGGTILLDSQIDGAEVEGTRIRRVSVNGTTYDVSALISTIPPRALAASVPLPAAFLEKFDLPYQGSVCLLLALDRPLTGAWWTNIMDSPVCFNAIVEHTQFRPRADYGADVCYLASYPPAGSRFFGMTPDAIFAEYFAGLKTLFPGLNDENVVDYRVVVDRHAAVVPRQGVAERMRALDITTPLDNLFVGGIVNSYPERSLNSCIARARECANAACPEAVRPGEAAWKATALALGAVEADSRDPSTPVR
jgi:protoporphyrinogen oxidase